MRRKRDTFWREAGAASGNAVALVAALALAAIPALAQQQNRCLAALQQINQQRSTALTQNAADLRTWQTDKQAAMDNCMSQAKPNDPSNAPLVAECQKGVQGAYDKARTLIDNAQQSTLTALANAGSQVATGPGCPWSAEQITQFVTAAAQAVAQLGQATAQIITAAKTKPAGASNASAGGASGSGAAKQPGSTDTSSSGNAAPKPPPKPTP